MAGKLSTHVLDTSRGKPAAGMRFTLFFVEGGARERVTAGETTADGRAPAPLLGDASFRPGRYELVYEVAAYFRAAGVELPEPPFLGEVTLAFGLAQDGHYHVPLLVSPFGYTTYRGS